MTNYSVRYKSHHEAAKSIKNRYQADVSKERYLEELLQKSCTEEKKVIYLHVPFCNKVCSFCPFHRPDRLKRREYHLYLIEQIKRLSELPYMQGEISAVNFGGGTPTSLLPEQMEQVLQALHGNFNIRADAEISVESSASELTAEMLQVLKNEGVNRLSIGIQTFQDEYRKLLGRRNTGEFAAMAVEAAIKHGIDNTNIDLLYHLPDQTVSSLEKDLKMIERLDVAGVSFYSLRIHENTPLALSLSDSQKAKMNQWESEYELFDFLMSSLERQRYEMLEFTKLVKDHRDEYRYMEIRHSKGSCIAIGQGAGGNAAQYYYSNAEGSTEISSSIPISSRGRVLTKEYQEIDAFIYEMQKGYIAKDKAVGAEFTRAVEELLEEGYLFETSRNYYFTKKGIFFGNNIINDLLSLMAAGEDAGSRQCVI